MRQPVQIKQETCQINSSVTVMLHDRKVEFSGLEPFCGIENVQAASLCGVFLAANALFRRPSLSRNLTGKSATGESRSRYRRSLLPLSKSSLAEAHLALSASCVVSDFLTTAMDAEAPSFQAYKQQYRCSIASLPRDGATSRMPTQPRAPRGLVSHTLKNVAARLSIACGPETSCCGTAASYLN